MPDRPGPWNLGAADIPRWVGVAALIALVYLAAHLPSELRPLPIVRTVPESGEQDVPVDTLIEILMEPGGVSQTFDAATPEIRLRYEQPEEATAALGPLVRAQISGETVRGLPDRPLQAGRRVRVEVSTRYGRDIVWSFQTASDSSGPAATPLPPLR